MKEAQIYLGDGKHLSMKSSTIVTLKNTLSLFRGENKSPLELVVNISADFDNIPAEYHHIFLQMLSVRYGGSINALDVTQDPFAVLKNKKHKWYEIWKNKD